MNKWKAGLIIVIVLAAVSFHARAAKSPQARQDITSEMVQNAMDCLQDVRIGSKMDESSFCTRARMGYVKFLNLRTDAIRGLTGEQTGNLWVFLALMWEAKAHDLGASTFMY